MILWRPVGRDELELIAESGFRAFPPRLPDQPIFYPVLNREYARQIARDWNPGDAASGYVGFVTRFEVEDDFCGRYERKIVGGREHEELWVPAEDLAAFNANIIGRIEVVEAHVGERFDGRVDSTTHLPVDLLGS